MSNKPDFPDTHESPAYNIIERLREFGAGVSYHDPLFSEFAVGDEDYTSKELTPELLRDDRAVIVTDHSEIDMRLVVDESSLVFDTRNATEERDADNVGRL